MAKTDSKKATGNSSKNGDQTMEHMDEKAASPKIEDNNQDKQEPTKSRRRSGRSKSITDSTAVEPAAKMDIDDEENEKSKDSLTDRSEKKSGQQATTTKTDNDEKLSSSKGGAPEAAANQKKDETISASTTADSNTKSKSKASTKSEPTEDISKTEGDAKDSEDNKADGNDDEMQEESAESEEDEYSEENDDEENGSNATRKRQRGRSADSIRAKRSRVKPTNRYEPVDFSVPKEKAATSKSPGRPPKRSASQPKPASTPQKTKGDYITVIKGQGMKLGDIPVIRKRVEESDIDSPDLYLVHRLLYSYKGRGSNKLFKTHILEYCGYMRKPMEGEKEEKVEEENAGNETFMSAKVFKYSIEKLKLFMDFFEIDRSPNKDGPLNKEAIVDRLLDFLCAPSLESMNPTDDSSSEEEEEESHDGDAITKEKEEKDDSKTAKTTADDKKKDDAATPEEQVAKKDGTDITKTEEAKKDDSAKETGAETKGTKPVDTEEQKNDAEPKGTGETPKDSQKSSATAEAKEKQTPKEESKKKEESKTDKTTGNKEQDEGVDRKTANSQTYQEWCKKARIEGAFYLVREHEKGDEPSDAALRQWVQAYVTCFDMSSATAKHAIETASARFGVNLVHRKDLIREFLVSEI